MKRITLCALFLTLFLLISCNTSGKNLTDDEVAKSDGTVIDLAKITNNITDAVAFAKDVKDVHTLVKSIDDIAKGVKKKITENGLADDANGSAHHTPLMAGVFSVATTIEAKAGELKMAESLKGLNGKVKDVEDKAKAFTAKLKNQHATLGVADGATTDANAKNAIDKSDNTGGKGKEELLALNTAIDTLLTAADAAVTSAINELTTPAKPSN
ncbi:Vsp/OspC family lipoprotein (plasmid) [Borrelia puertoricensis]|uniref:Vsp/OspC family lipoprotein n=1 Tax=Borrelia puertoricensis TaxID=2756107 RepID=UPI003EBE3D4D